MENCIFCNIVAGKLPSYKIYEDEKYLAILDIFANCEGHTLVIPKEHIEWVWDVPGLGEYFEVVGKIARHHREIAGEPVRSMIFGWQIPHAHIHIKPGKENTFDGVSMLSQKQLELIQKKYCLT
ncbi:MAG: HIT domain-containing protein [bacterium]